MTDNFTEFSLLITCFFYW